MCGCVCACVCARLYETHLSLYVYVCNTPMWKYVCIISISEAHVYVFARLCV